MGETGLMTEAAERVLERLVRRTQAQARIPALSVALHRADRPLWTFQVGDSGREDAPLDEGTTMRIGSVTKTFTAVLVLQCRDDGLLGQLAGVLEDRGALDPVVDQLDRGDLGVLTGDDRPGLCVRAITDSPQRGGDAARKSMLPSMTLHSTRHQT